MNNSQKEQNKDNFLRFIYFSFSDAYSIFAVKHQLFSYFVCRVFVNRLISYANNCDPPLFSSDQIKEVWFYVI